MNNPKGSWTFTLLGIGLAAGVIIAWILFSVMGARPNEVSVGPIKFGLPTATPVTSEPVEPATEPVPSGVVSPVEVTRIVEKPVTAEVTRLATVIAEKEVTREVEVPATVIVTREVPATVIVKVSTERVVTTTPFPTLVPTPTPECSTNCVLYQADWSKGIDGWTGGPEWKAHPNTNMLLK